MPLSLTPSSDYLQLLKNCIDPSRVPFSDRGSRILVYEDPDRDQLYIRIAERLTDIQPGMETYLTRPPLIQDLALIDDEGNPLGFQRTSYPHSLMYKTRIGMFILTFHNHDTLVIGLPPNKPGGIRFNVKATDWEKLVRGGKVKSLRNIVYHSNCKTIRHEISSTESGSVVDLIIESNDDPFIEITISPDLQADRTVPPFSQVLEGSEERWHAWFAKAPEILSHYRQMYYYAWWVMANNLVAPRGFITTEAMMPSKAHYYGIWNWDTCFHALAFRHSDPKLARDQLMTILDNQLDDGMLPDAVYDGGIVDRIDHPIEGKVTKPPLIAWAALKIDKIDNDRDFLSQIYGPLKRWNEWWLGKRTDRVTGLTYYAHPYSSGLDDSPAWDHGMPVISPDINTYLIIQRESLAKMASAIGRHEEAHAWRKSASEATSRMVKGLYLPSHGQFFPMKNGKHIHENTIVNLFPLWTGQLPSAVTRNLIAELTNNQSFWAPFPLSTVAQNSPAYSPIRMWRGPTWANINYIFIEALDLAGYQQTAHELRKRSLTLLSNNDGLFEFYDPGTGKPPDAAVPSFGWTAAVFIDLALQATFQGTK